MKTKFVWLVLFSVIVLQSYSQTLSKNWVSYGLGISLSNEQLDFTINGAKVCVGFKRAIWKDKLNSNFTVEVGSKWYGLNSAKRDEAISDANFCLTLDYDLIGYKNVFFNIEAGPFMGVQRNLKGTGTEYNSAMSIDVMHTVSEIENSFGYGGVFLASVKVVSPNKKYAFKVCPVGLQLGNVTFGIYGFVGLSVRL